MMPGWGDSGQGLRVHWFRTPGLLAPEPRDSGPKKRPPQTESRGALVQGRMAPGVRSRGSVSLLVAEVEDGSMIPERTPDCVGQRTRGLQHIKQRYPPPWVKSHAKTASSGDSEGGNGAFADGPVTACRLAFGVDADSDTGLLGFGLLLDLGPEHVEFLALGGGQRALGLLTGRGENGGCDG